MTYYHFHRQFESFEQPNCYLMVFENVKEKVVLRAVKEGKLSLRLQYKVTVRGKID
jgi:hypothetical protein